jgi:DNA-binding NarL/FixJ family response regulator
LVAPAPVRILIADDHELVRRGLRSLLGSRPGWEICGEARDGVEAIEMAKRLRPDLILLDITMPRLNGLEAARVIHREVPRTQILILSQHDKDDMSANAFEAGARGYVSKSDVAHKLFSSMEAVLDVNRE